MKNANEICEYINKRITVLNKQHDEIPLKKGKEKVAAVVQEYEELLNYIYFDEYTSLKNSSNIHKAALKELFE